jgi:hypothetical protein
VACAHGNIRGSDDFRVSDDQNRNYYHTDGTYMGFREVFSRNSGNDVALDLNRGSGRNRLCIRKKIVNN